MKLNRKQLWASLITMLLVGATAVTMVPMVKVASASPDTHFFVDPPEVGDVQPGNTFLIKINVTEAPPSYAWEIYLSWNRDLLELITVVEGDFLHRWVYFPPFPPQKKYLTSFTSIPLDEANAKGETLIGCSLTGDPATVEWASGDGWLVSLGFNVTALGSSVLNLHKTRLYDHIDIETGYPASTHYPNLDGFFYNVGIHDIAITNVTASPTEVAVGDNVTITVTVKNEGNYTETFNVTVYADVIVYNMTAEWWPDEIVIGDEITVGTQTNITLSAGASTTLPTFTWDTTGVAGETYTISANATLTSSADDDPRDNTFIDDKVTVRWDHDIAITNVTASPTEVAVGDNVTITVTVKNEGNYPETLNVTVYYDGTTIETKTSISLENGTSTTLTFTWDTTDVAKGTYTIKAEASAVPDEIDTDDNAFEDGTVTLLIPPVAKFTENATTVFTGEVISFDASSSEDPDGSIVSYFWDFGDETNATGMTVTHAYVDDGVYTVTLTVTDNEEETDTTTSTKTVLNRQPVAIFTESAETVDTGETITFNASDSYDPDGSIVSYFWDFGDGTNATGVTVEHAYTDDGTYTVTLTVTDNDDATDSASATKTVKAPEGWPIVWYAVIGLGIAALTLIALYALYRRRKG